MKRCGFCKTHKPLGDFGSDRGNKDGLCRYCRPCMRAYQKQWRINNAERAKATDRGERERHRDRRRRQCRERYYANRESELKKRRQYLVKWKDAAFAAYGGHACACCGETERNFLCIDHINNDGHAHRKLVRTDSLYRWLRDNHYPPGFQILCANCNFGKRMNGGVCPHKSEAAYGVKIVIVKVAA